MHLSSEVSSTTHATTPLASNGRHSSSHHHHHHHHEKRHSKNGSGSGNNAKGSSKKAEANAAAAAAASNAAANKVTHIGGMMTAETLAERTIDGLLAEHPGELIRTGSPHIVSVCMCFYSPEHSNSIRSDVITKRLGVHRSAESLAQQQDSAGCFQGGCIGRSFGWDTGHGECRK